MTNPALSRTWTGLPSDLRDAVLRKLVARRLAGDGPAPLRLGRADVTAEIPVTLEQRAFLDQQARFDGRIAWTIAASPIILDTVDGDRVREAVEALARRHDVLHSTFSVVGDRTTIRLRPDGPVPFKQTTLPLTAALTGVEGWVRKRYAALLAEPFDPVNGPLWRAELVSRAGRGVLLLCFCSLIVDGESLYLIDRDLRALTGAAGSGPLPPAPAWRYIDYAHTQAEHLAGGRFDAALDWWRERLSGGPPAVWTDGRAPVGRTELHEQVLAPDTGRALDAFAASRRTTAPVVVLTEFMARLRALDRSDDLWVASATAKRDLPGTEEMVGTFARLVLLRHRWSPLDDPLAGVHAMLADSMEQEPVPHLLVRQMMEAAYPRAPSPFRYIFNYRLVGPDHGGDPVTSDIAYRAGPDFAAADREEDILLMVLQSGERRTLHWYLRSDRFDAAQARHLLTGFHTDLRRRIAAG